MTLPNDLIEQVNRANAEQAVNVARGHKWPIPQRYLTVRDRYHEAYRLAHVQPPTTPNLPDDPTKLERVLRGHAADVATHRALLEVAEETAASAGRDMTIAVRSELPEWVDKIRDEFTAAVAAFLGAVHVAPNRELTGYEDDGQVAAMMAQRRVLATLDRLLDERVALGTSIGEADCHRGLLWMVLEPPQPTSENIEAGLPQQLTTAAKEYNSRLFQDQHPYERWRHVASLGAMSLPRLGQVHARVEVFDRLRGHFASGPLMTAQGQAAHRDEQARKRDDRLRSLAALQAARDANTAEVHRQRQLAAGL